MVTHTRIPSHYIFERSVELFIHFQLKYGDRRAHKSYRSGKSSGSISELRFLHSLDNVNISLRLLTPAANKHSIFFYIFGMKSSTAFVIEYFIALCTLVDHLQVVNGISQRGRRMIGDRRVNTVAYLFSKTDQRRSDFILSRRVSTRVSVHSSLCDIGGNLSGYFEIDDRG